MRCRSRVALSAAENQRHRPYWMSSASKDKISLQFSLYTCHNNNNILLHKFTDYITINIVYTYNICIYCIVPGLVIIVQWNIIFTCNMYTFLISISFGVERSWFSTITFLNWVEIKEQSVLALNSPMPTIFCEIDHEAIPKIILVRKLL